MCKSCFHSWLFHLSYYDCTRIPKSPIWDPLTGFGGDGVPGTYVVPTDPDPTNSSRIFPELYHGCVKDGPFADYTLKLGPGLLVTEHCIARGVGAAAVSIYLNSTTIAYTLSLPTFEQFRVELEGTLVPFILGPHGGGHGAVGGDMANFFSSSGGKYLNTRKVLSHPFVFMQILSSICIIVILTAFGGDGRKHALNVSTKFLVGTRLFLLMEM